MADTTVSTNVTQEQWADDFFREYVRTNLFAPYTGTGSGRIIQVNEKLSREPGDRISFQVVARLKAAGVTGNTALKGNEEALANYAHKVNVTTRRNGVVVTGEEQQKTNIELLQAARGALMDWAMEDLRDLIITALQAIGTSDGENITYASASEANKDSWLANNADRVLFGVAVANNSSNDHSASLANIDNTADQLGASIISLAKRRCKTADPRIRPFRVGTGNRAGEEWFVLFANSLAFRDAKEDSTILQANREAWTRGADNPIFRDGDLLYDGVIIREVPEIAVISGVGAGSIDVAPNFMCGAQSVGVGYASRFRPVFDNDDYGFRRGVGVASNYGVEKLFFNTSQHGVHTVYTAGVADA